jgi:hypothetical protein
MVKYFAASVLSFSEIIRRFFSKITGKFDQYWHLRIKVVISSLVGSICPKMNYQKPIFQLKSFLYTFFRSPGTHTTMSWLLAATTTK